MDAHDDIVETSDLEELEELAAASPSYWEKNVQAPDARRVHFGIPASPPAMSDARNGSVLFGSFLPRQEGEVEMSDNRPRKRRKLDSASTPSTSHTTQPEISSPTSPRSHCSTLGSSSPPSQLVPSPLQLPDLDYRPESIASPVSPISRSSPVTRQPLSRHTSRGSLSPSPDPLLLFTPPPQHPEIDAGETSDLTPISSPPAFGGYTEKSVSHPASPSSACTSPPRPPQPPSPATQHALQQALASEGIRYSLRARNAQQLNPYEYDKRLYKRQMRSNPDALVKVVSPPRPRRRSTSARPHEGSSGAEDEYQAENEEDEEAAVRRRRKGKERAVDEGGGAELGEREMPWFQSLDSQSSGGSDSDEAEKILAGIHLMQKKERRRKKARPFPMKRKDLQHSPSPDARTRTSPPAQQPSLARPHPRPRPRKQTEISPDDAHEPGWDEPPETGPLWRRHRSATVLSNRNSDSQPGGPLHVDHASFDGQDYDVPMWMDEFARGQSPLHLSLGSPTRASSSEPQVPPSTSDVNEVIDLTSDASSSSESDSADKIAKRQWKALNSMMPRKMALQLIEQARRRQESKQARTSASVERDSEDERGRGSDVDRPLRPGESRRRIRSGILSTRSIAIRGDSESSDVDIPPSPAKGRAPTRDIGGVHLAAEESSDDTGLSSSEESVIEPIGHQPRPKYRPRVVSGLAADDIHSLSEYSDDDDGRALERAPVKRRKQHMGLDGEAEVDNSIDRMLSRTDYNKPRTKRRRRKGARRGTGGGGGGGSGRQARGGGGDHANSADGGRGSRTRETSLRVTTSGAKQYGSGRQTLLPFKRLPTPEPMEGIEILDAPPLPLLPNEVQLNGGESARAKQKAAKAKAKTAGVYVFGGVGDAHLLGGRANPAHVTIDQEIVAPRVPLLRDDNRARPPPTSKSKLQRRSSKVMQGSKLEDYWVPEEYENDGFVVPDGPLPERRSSQQNGVFEQRQRVTVDLDIIPLLAGIAFPGTTYLGHGWLHELVNLLPGTQEVPAPHSCSVFDVYLHSDMSAAELCASLDSVSDQLRDLILGRAAPPGCELCHKWQMFLHSLSQHVSWFLVDATDEDKYILVTEAVGSFTRRLASIVEQPLEILPEDETPNPLVLQVLWFLLEMSCRLACDRRHRGHEIDKDMVLSSFTTLMVRLWDFTFDDRAVQLDLSREAFVTTSTMQQVAELWVCMINLAENATFQTSFLPETNGFWSTFSGILQTKSHQATHTDLKGWEVMWKSVFTICALSQFTIHGNSSMTPRISPSWNTILTILERAPLAHEPNADQHLSRRLVRKRDEYVRVLVCRCLWLNLKWHWRLDVDEAAKVINRLNDVFKSRRFASLADEQSDFPGFLRHNNIALLQEKKSSDTAFTLFLKLVVRAAEDTRKNTPQYAQSKVIPSGLKKILSLAVPVSSVSFTKETPPSNHELSMLYNRYSAIAVAIYLEPTEVNLKSRLVTARRYVDFRKADDETRRACIRGAMHLAILIRHLGLSLTVMLEWWSDMTNVLIDEYQASEAAKIPPMVPRLKDSIVISIQLLLGSVRRILETSSMDPAQSEHKYPEPALLQGPWVFRVFSNATNLSTLPSIGDEIRRLVQAFLDARSRVIPKPRRPQPRVEEDSQETQYDYGQFDLDLNDPELLAALGEDVGPSDYKENKEKDKVVCEIIDKHISQAIYRLVCKHFNDPIYQQAKELSFQNADKWVDCWVSCASVVVQNGYKKWNFYLDYGPQSWEKIIEPDWRRRVGLRFMFMLLQLDPPAYQTHMDRFIDVLLESMATPHVTIEHDYASLLFSIDGLHHPLLIELPIDPPAEDGDYHLTRHGFVEKRPAMLEAMFKNLSNNLSAAAHGAHTLIGSNQIHITSVLTLLSTMKDIYERYPPNSQARASYVTFCKQISDLLSRYPSLQDHPRLAQLIAWLHGVS